MEKQYLQQEIAIDTGHSSLFVFFYLFIIMKKNIHFILNTFFILSHKIYNYNPYIKTMYLQ